MNARKKLRNYFLIWSIIFLSGCLVFGRLIFNWMDNYQCFALLGCNMGFFGYDGFMHFLSGIMQIFGILWLASFFPKLSLFSKGNFWRNILVCIAVIALIAVLWEIMEYSYDTFRVLVLHMQLLIPDHLAQPTNADTMGDITLSLIGSVLTLAMLTISRSNMIESLL